MNMDQKTTLSQFVEQGYLGIALEEVKKDLAFKMLATAPHQVAERESLYYQSVNLDTLLTLIQGYTNDIL